VHGSSALHYAVTMQQQAAVQLLINSGADQELVNHQGYSALNSPIYQPSADADTGGQTKGGRGTARAGQGRGHAGGSSAAATAGKMTAPAMLNSMDPKPLTLEQIKEGDSDASASVFGPGAGSIVTSSPAASDTGTVVSGASESGVEVKKWKFALPASEGQGQKQQDADKAYLAFSAASGVSAAPVGCGSGAACRRACDMWHVHPLRRRWRAPVCVHACALSALDMYVCMYVCIYIYI